MAWTAIPNRFVSLIRLVKRTNGWKWMPLLMPRRSGAVKLAIVLKAKEEWPSNWHNALWVMQGASALSHFRSKLCLCLNFAIMLSWMRWGPYKEAGWLCRDERETNNELVLLVQLIQTTLYLISSTSHYKVMKDSYHLLWWMHLVVQGKN